MLDLRPVLFFIFLFVTVCAGVVWQLLSFLLVKPFSRSKHNELMAMCQGSYLKCFCYLMDQSIKLELSGDEIDSENAVFLPNHMNHDWAHLFLIHHHRGNLDGVRTVLKGSTKFIPGFGQVMYLNNWPYVSRDWKKDQIYLTKLFRVYKEQKMRLCLWIFPEGTRITPKKLAKSQSYAAKTGKPAFKHVMLPRYKAVMSAISSLRPGPNEAKGVVDNVYECTIAYKGWGEGLWGFPSLAQLLISPAGGDFKLQMHVKKVAIKDLPVEEAGLKSWLLNSFQDKDKLLEYRKEHGCFPGDLRVEPPKPVSDCIPSLIFWGSTFAVSLFSIIRFLF